MKTRITSFLLMLVMVVLAVPAFVLPSSAVEVPADYTSKWVENEPSVSATDGVSYPSDAWRIGYKTSAEDLVVFGTYCPAGGEGMMISATGYDQWDNGGYYAAGHGGQNNKGIATAAHYMAYRYVAEYNGKATLAVNALYMLGGANGANSVFAIAVNGDVKWPTNATYDDKANWHHSTTVGANIANEIPALNVTLNKGDKVEFLFAHAGDAWSHYDFSPVVSYTTFDDSVTLPYTSKWLDSMPKIEGGVVKMPEGPWSVGRLSGDRTILYTKNPSETILTDADLWSTGGIFLGSKQNGDATTKHSGSRYMVVKRNTFVTYVAEYTGTATFSVADLKVDGGNDSTESSFAICLMQNGKVVWPANAKADNVATWYTPTKVRENIANEIPDITLDVKKGDAISFTIASNGKGGKGAWGCYDLNPSITYTALETAETNKGTLETPIVTPFNAYIAIDDNAGYTLYTGAWKPVQYNRGNETKASDALLLTTIKKTSNGYYVQPAGTGTGHNGGWASYMATTGCSWAPLNYFSIPGNVSTGWRYDVPSTGIYNFSVDSLIQGLGCASAATVKNVHFAVYVNNEKVWPAGDAWYTLPTHSVDYAATVNEAAASVLNNMELDMGDKVEFLLNGEGGAWDCVAVGTFTATQIAQTAKKIPVTPEVENGSITLNDKFAANFFVDVDALPENATKVGAYVNGNFVAAADNGMVTLGDIAAKNLADAITVQPTYKVRGKEVVGETTTVTAADMLMQYVTDDVNNATSNLAIATLNYAAAAQTYFAYNTENLANAGLSDEQKALTYANTYADGHKVEGEGAAATVYGIKLMLNDTADIAVYFNSDKDLTNGYSAVCKNGEETYSVKFVKVENSETLYKAIFEGFMPTAWDADLEFSVTDGEKTVSETLTYSVTDYCFRMQGSAIDAVVDAMLALYEAADAYTDTLK